MVPIVANAERPFSQEFSHIKFPNNPSFLDFSLITYVGLRSRSFIVMFPTHGAFIENIKTLAGNALSYRSQDNCYELAAQNSELFLWTIAYTQAQDQTLSIHDTVFRNVLSVLERDRYIEPNKAQGFKSVIQTSLPIED